MFELFDFYRFKDYYENMKENFGEQFLHKNDPKLHVSNPIEHEKARKSRLDEKVSQKPADKITDWLKVIEKTHLKHKDDESVLERIKEYYHKEYVIKPENIPESAFLLEQKITRAQGHGIIEITDSFKQQKIKEIIGNQEKSLDKWVDYLSSSDAMYSMWAKYWTFNSMIKMGKLEKKEDENTKAEKSKFVKREKDTTASFPPLNPRALAMTISVIEAKAKENIKDKKERNEIENMSKKLDETEFKNLLNSENFSKIYTQFLIEMPEYSKEGLKETRGEWVKYNQGSKPDELVKSLEGYPLEWCTANTDTARTQLQDGDFHVYYSINEDGEAKIPRVAIRMASNNIAEVRGIAPDQNVDPYISDVVKEKMTEFPDGEQYKKKSYDMKRLTEIEEKNNLKQEFNKDELIFLYEMDSKIEGFGQHADPRAQELRDNRDAMRDALIILDCTKEEIATNINEIHVKTKAYIGPLIKGIFEKLSSLEYVYTSFPNRRLQQMEIKSDVEYPQTKDAWMRAYKEKNISLGKSLILENDTSAIEEMLEKMERTVLSENQRFVGLTVADLGFDFETTYQKICDKAKSLGLDLCAQDDGPKLRLLYDQLINDYVTPAMKFIKASDGELRMWHFSRNSDGKSELDRRDFYSPGKWSNDHRFIFRIRNKNHKILNIK